ncbi:MAG: hypothetical protein SGARI_007454 [Bacillariaceae sp.]
MFEPEDLGPFQEAESDYSDYVRMASLWATKCWRANYVVEQWIIDGIFKIATIFTKMAMLKIRPRRWGAFCVAVDYAEYDFLKQNSSHCTVFFVHFVAKGLFGPCLA